MKMMRMIAFRCCAAARTTRYIAAGLLIGGLAPTALSEPTGGSWETGTGSIVNTNGGDVAINADMHNSIINWNTFNIDAGQRVDFNLPSSSSRVLNRISAANGMSLIAGTLQANGHLYLINSAGIAFSSTAVLNAGRIYAAAGSMSSPDFLSNKDLFSGLNGTIVNAGQITGDEVHFAGNRVINLANGVVDGGLVSFSTGDSVHIQRVGSGISLRIDNEDLGDPSPGPVTSTLSGWGGISNAGTVKSSSGGPIHLAAGDMFGLALLNSGTIQTNGGAVELSARGGAIYNRSSGSISTASSSGNGGDILINAPAVVNRGLIDSSSSSFTASDTAGTIDIDTYANALFTNTSVLRATSSVAGDGGDISVSASNGTVAFAEGSTVQSKGGFMAGDGGTVSIAGEKVAYYATTKVGSSSGDDGTLKVSVGESVDVFTPTVIHNDPALIADLDVGCTITSRVGDNVLNFFDGHVELSSQHNVAINKTFNLRNHDLTLNAGHNVLMAAEPTAIGNLNVEALHRIDLLANLNDISGDANFTANDIAIGGGGVQVTTGGSQFWDGAVQLGADLSIVTTDATFTGDINGGHDLAVNGTGTVSLMNVGNIDVVNSIDLTADLLELNGSEMIADNDILLSAAGRATLSNAATIVGSAADLRIQSINGDIRMGQNEAFTQYGGDLTMRALNGEIDLGGVNTLGNMTIDAPSIRLLRHEGGLVLLPDGSLAFMPGLHLLAGGTIDFSSAPTLAGLGLINPVFASTAFSPDSAGILSGYEWIDNVPLNVDDFVATMANGGQVVLNVMPKAVGVGPEPDPDPDPDPGGGTDGPGTVVPPADPIPGPAVDLTAGISDAELNEATTIAAGEQLGILNDDEPVDAENPLEGPLTLVTLADLSIEIERVADSPQDQLGTVSRSDVLANYPINNVNPDTGNIRVKERRLKGAIVERTLLMYQDVLSQQPGDALSNIENNNTTPIADSLQTSWTAYATAESDPTPSGFRTYLDQNEGQATTRSYVDGLRTVFNDLGQTGVTGYELKYSRDTTSQRILDSATASGGSLNSAGLSSLLQ